MPRLVIVSNRVAPPDKPPSAGGMAVALKAALESEQGLWFGWSGDICPDDRAMEDTSQIHDGNGGYRTVTVDLTQAQFSGFYEEFANRSLWPLLHNRLDLVSFARADFATYCQVNKLFCDCLMPELRADDLIWVQDYHLTLVGRDLRQRDVESPLGFFLHTPFPPADTVLALPWWREIVDALLEYDVLGFQTPDDVHNFSDLVVRKLGGRREGEGVLAAGDRRCRVEAFPIGIDTAAFAEMAASASGRGGQEQYIEWVKDSIVIIGVDRLDYSKGLDRRFLAYETFLTHSPDDHGRVAFLQIAAPSREDVPEYVHMREELETLAGHINGRFTELDWVPLRYINKPLDQESLAALYRLSRIGLVTPLKDGMNIVAKEYVAAQSRDDPGVLILSQFSGAADELQEALIVNPYDVDGVADAIRTALEMPLDERQRRYDCLFHRLESNTVHDWCNRFLTALEARRGGNAG